jgi:hypothetical protein
MIRRLLMLTLLASGIVVALTAATSARTSKPATKASTATAARTAKPAIKAIEVGYFGTGLVAHRIDVFVYSNVGPRADTRVTVCVKGVCERARGHNGTLAWYQASFASAPLRMGAPVTFSATVSNSAGRSKTKVTQGLLCMHNNGSTPQA